MSILPYLISGGVFQLINIGCINFINWLICCFFQYLDDIFYFFFEFYDVLVDWLKKTLLENLIIIQFLVPQVKNFEQVDFGDFFLNFF